MSTLKVAAINNPSAGSGGLAISTTGNVSGAGLDLITSQSFTAASTVSVDNCFTSAYENYRFQLLFTSMTSAGFVRCRLRASGSDNSASTYDVVMIGANNTSAFAARAFGETSFQMAGAGGANRFAITGDILSPALAANTTMHFTTGLTIEDTGTFWQTRTVSAQHFTASAFDGFTFYPSSGTVTGTVRVYGYRN